MKMQKAIPAFPVTNIERSCQYFKNRLGFNIAHQEKTFAIAVRDDAEIHLWQSCDKSWKWRSFFLFLKPVWTGAESFIAGTVSCRIAVTGVDELYAEYKAKGVLHSADTVVVAQPWGHREFPVVDNHGNLITFFEAN